jgi:hypothetical protein
MIENKVIIKETDKGNGIYIIEIDEYKAGQLVGETMREKVANAVNDFLSPTTNLKSTNVSNYVTTNVNVLSSNDE